MTHSSRADDAAASPLTVLGWWAATVVTLVVLDDLTFGPAFWALSRIAGAPVAIAAIYVIYVPTQVYIVWCGTREDPGRFASFFLRRLDLKRRNPQMRENEGRLRSRIGGGVSAVLMSLLVAGVLPPLVLYRRGRTRRFVRQLSVVTATVYATEFAVLHGFLPSLL